MPDYLNMHRSKPTIMQGRTVVQAQPRPPLPPAPVSAARFFSLRQLEAQLEKVVSIPTDDVETEGECKGLYVWRDEDGKGFFWSPRPIRYAFEEVASTAEADTIMFLCPLCFAANGGAKGTHSVMVSFAGRNVPDEAGSRDSKGKPSRWTASGTGLDDLVLTPSILLTLNGCNWHGFVGSSGIPPGHAG